MKTRFMSWLISAIVICAGILFGQSGAQPSKEYIRINGRLVAIESIAPAPCAAATSNLAFRSTGHDGQALLAVGSVDPNWSLISNASNYATSQAIIRNSSNGGSNTQALHINPSGASTNEAPGIYVYRQKLDLSCHNPSTVSIQGLTVADDNVSIYVNGKFVLGPIASWNSQVSFAIPSNTGFFVQGWNMIDFVVENTGTSPNPTQLRVQITQATAAPAPSASGAKFEVTRTPTGGNLAGNAAVQMSSGSEAVTWSVDGTHTGTLNSTNTTTASYTGPGFYSQTTVVPVRATSAVDTSRIAFQPLWFNPGGAAGTVTISGNSGTGLAAGQTRTLTASVSNVPNGQPSTVRWSIQSNPPGNSPAGGSLSTGTNCAASTVYTAPSTITNNSAPVVIRAESCHNTAWTSTASVNLNLGSTVQVTLSPKNFTTQPNNTALNFTASVTGASSNANVNWSISGQGTLSNVTSTSVTYNPNGNTGTVTIVATSAENPNRSDSHTFTLQSAGQGGSGNFNPTSGTLDSALTLTINGGSSVTNIGEVWVNLSTSATTNIVPGGSACRLRYSRITLPDRLQLDTAAGSGNPWKEARFNTMDLPENGVCAIVASQSSVAINGANLTLTIRLQNRGMTGTRYAWVWTALPQNGSSPMAPQMIGSWTPNPPSAITLTSSQGSTATVSDGLSVSLYAQVANMPTGAIINWQLQTQDGSISNTTPPSGFQGAAVYTAGVAGNNRTVHAIARLLNSQLQELGSAAFAINVVSSQSQLPSLTFVNPFNSTWGNPSVLNQTLAANGSTYHWANWGVDNRDWAATSGMHYIRYLYLNINRNFTESTLAQHRADSCRVRLEVMQGWPSAAFWVSLMDDAGMFYQQSQYYNPSWGANWTTSNSQCTVEFNTSIGAYAMTPFTNPNFLGTGMRFRFNTGFQGQRPIYMMGERSSGLGWSGWQYRGVVNLN